jgi:uncharacterized protein YecT (DUF1311 family)
MALVVVVFLLATSARAADQVPASLVGAWDVEHVAVDEQDQMHWDMRPDDPQLLGRELLIQPDTITFTGDEKPTCQQSTWKARTLEWSKLFARTFSRSPGNGRPVPSDFGLKVDKADKATYYEICPDPGAVSRALAAYNRRWVVQRKTDVLVMHYSDQVLLTLLRRPKGARPRASFDCGKATTPTETTICASFDLAGWDRSVATAYKQALKRSPEKDKDLRDDQHRWLAKRDTCGAKTDCIDEMLWRRVEELRQK